MWLQIGIALVILVVLELVARVYENVAAGNPYNDSRSEADAYAHDPWATELLREYNERTVRWRRYVYWIGSPFASRYTNVNADGIRKTWRGPSTDAKCIRPLRIFMFGGSTMWGEGARDDYTIASWLQRMLSAKDSCALITNFGQDGYVSTQEMILLEEQIQKENIPDIAIFYDGYNDAHSALTNDAAGLTYDEKARKREFNIGNLVTPDQWGQLATHWELLTYVSAKDFVDSLGLSWVARRIVAKIRPGTYLDVHGVLVRNPGPPLTSNRANSLENATARDYLANVRMIEGISRRFEFRCLFFWQPWLGDKFPLSPYEQEQMNTLLPGQRDFVEGVRERVAEGNTDGTVRFLSDVFSDRARSYFIDEVHVTGAGNELIAERILPGLLQTIAAIRSAKQATPAARTIKSTPSPVPSERTVREATPVATTPKVNAAAGRSQSALSSRN